MKQFERAHKKITLWIFFILNVLFFLIYYFESLKSDWLNQLKKNPIHLDQKKIGCNKKIYSYDANTFTELSAQSKKSILHLPINSENDLYEEMQYLKCDLKINKNEHLETYVISCDKGVFHPTTSYLELQQPFIEEKTDKYFQANAKKIEVFADKKPFKVVAYDLKSYFDHEL